MILPTLPSMSPTQRLSWAAARRIGEMLTARSDRGAGRGACSPAPAPTGSELQRLLHGGAEVRRGTHGDDTGPLQRGKLLVGRALAAGDDGAGMAHALARGGGDTGDVGHHRLLHMVLDVLGRLFLGGAAD